MAQSSRLSLSIGLTDGRIVTCSVTIGDKTMQGKATLNIKKPMSTLSRDNQGTAFFGPVNSSPHALSLRPPGNQPVGDGIQWSASVTEPTGFAEGQWNMVQLSTLNVEQSYSDQSPDDVSDYYGEEVLDTAVPYPGYLVGTPPNTNDSTAPTSWPTGNGIIRSYDNPVWVLIPAVSKSALSWSYRTFLMFLPPGPNSRYVPLRFFSWSFTATVASSDNQQTWSRSNFSPIADAGNLASSEIAGHPTWTANLIPIATNFGPLTITGPATVIGGSGALQLTVGVVVRVPNDVTINLTSNNTVITVPASVVLRAGQSSVNVSCTVNQRYLSSGTQEVKIIASISSYPSGETTIPVLGNN